MIFIKNIFLFLATTLLWNTVVTAQTTRTLKKVSEFKMPKTAEDSMPGKNGASIVWHTLQKKYYASMAGNSQFPLAVFNETGKRLSSENLTAMIDVRGLWFNPQKELLCGNGYNDNGWFHYILDPKGTVNDVEVDIAEMAQPNAQCVGTYNSKSNEVMFLNGNQVSLYSNVGSANNKVNLRFGLAKKDDIGEMFEMSTLTPEDYNYTVVIYSGIKNAELGVLNIEKNQIELYGFDEGFLNTVLKLPESQVTYSAFNFAYTNGMYWFFDKETRVWTSYK